MVLFAPWMREARLTEDSVPHFPGDITAKYVIDEVTLFATPFLAIDHPAQKESHGNKNRNLETDGFRHIEKNTRNRKPANIDDTDTQGALSPPLVPNQKPAKSMGKK